MVESRYYHATYQYELSVEAYSICGPGSEIDSFFLTEPLFDNNFANESAMRQECDSYISNGDYLLANPNGSPERFVFASNQFACDGTCDGYGGASILRLYGYVPDPFRPNLRFWMSADLPSDNDRIIVRALLATDPVSAVVAGVIDGFDIRTATISCDKDHGSNSWVRYEISLFNVLEAFDAQPSLPRVFGFLEILLSSDLVDSGAERKVLLDNFGKCLLSSLCRVALKWKLLTGLLRVRRTISSKQCKLELRRQVPRECCGSRSTETR